MTPALLLCSLLGQMPDPPAWGDPLAARAAARSAEPLRGAELALFAGDPRSAEASLERAPEGGRRLRLEAAAALARGQIGEARRRLEALDRIPGFDGIAARLEPEVSRRGLRAGASTAGAIMFAVALTLLTLGGLGELVRVGRDTVILAALTLAAAFAASRGGSPRIAFLAVSVLLLGHATLSTARRIEPGARGRALVLAMFVLGIGGAGLAIAAA